MTGILRRYAAARRWGQILFVLGGSLLSSAAGSLAKLYGPPNDAWLYELAIFGSVAVFTVGALFLFIDEGASEVTARALDAIDEMKELNEGLDDLAIQFAWMARLYSTARALRDYLQGVMADGVSLHSGRDGHIAQLVDLVLAEKQVLFSMGDEAWNFAVYLFDSEDQLLKCVLCRRPLRQEEETPHRSWRRGDGHVGIAYERNEELVAADMTNPEIEPFFRAPGAQYKTDDSIRYRSIASIPIGMAAAEPLGVLVATSDHGGRFIVDGAGIDNVEPLRLLSSTLAMMLHANNVQGKEQ